MTCPFEFLGKILSLRCYYDQMFSGMQKSHVNKCSIDTQKANCYNGRTGRRVKIIFGFRVAPKTFTLIAPPKNIILRRPLVSRTEKLFREKTLSNNVCEHDTLLHATKHAGADWEEVPYDRTR